MISLKMVKGSELAEGVVADMQLPEPLTRFSIGRDPGNQWAIADRTLAISARHCEIVATDAGPALRDLSTNGTFVNGGVARLAGDHLLQDGDRIELGPYILLVQLPRAAAAAAPARDGDAAPGLASAAGAVAPPPRSVGVEATAPHRGGDPAAMLAAGSRPQRVGLTEILRSAPPAEDSGVEMTKIRPAPRPPPPAHPVTSGPGAAAAAPARAASPAPVAAPVPPPVRMPVPMPAPSPVRAPVLTPRVESAAAPPAPSAGGRYAAVDPASAAADAAAGGDAPALQQLSIGLGLAPDALAGRDPAQATAQLGALARAAVTVLRQLLEQQAQERRQIGSRAPALVPVRELNPLRLAATPQAALLALMAPGADAEAALQRAAAELAAHQKRLMAAFRGAATRLGQEMAPASLAQALGLATADAAGAARTAGAAEQARLWQLYSQLWQCLGLAAGQPWEQGFLEAALMHLAAAYDDPAKP